MSGTSGISSMLNNKFRLTGLASGLDTDSMVQSLMKLETAKLEKIRQEKQMLEWKRDDYRSMINALRGFKDQYFDVLKPATNFKSVSSFSATDASSSNTGAVGVTAGSGAVAGTYAVTVAAVAELAVKNGVVGASKGYSGLTGANPVDMSKMKEGKAFSISLDGVPQTITLDQDYTGFTEANFATALEGLIDNAFGPNKINVTESGGALTFTPVTASSTLTISDSGNTYPTTLGFSDGQSNAITSGTITNFSGGNFKIAIDAGAAVDISVADAGGDRDTLVSNINDALTAAGLDADVQAIADPNNAAKVKFVTLDTATKVTFTAGTTDNMLTKLGIANHGAIQPMNGSIAYGASDTGKDFYINVNGTQHYIELDYNYANDADVDSNGDTLAQAIQAQLDSGGATGVTVNIAGGKISFSNPSGDVISVTKGDGGLRDELGFSGTQNNSRVDLNSKLGNAALATAFTFDGSGDLSFTINGVTLSANEDETLSTVINRINSSSAGVRLKYDSLKDRFIMESKTTGTTAAINNTDDTGNFFAALKIDTLAEARGTNARVTIGTTDVERTTNKFTVEGISYDVKALGASTVTVSANPDALLGKIKDFAAKYNEVIDKINDKLGEKQYKDYLPLSDEQKSQLSETEAELWESKAKSGSLRGDALLQRVTDAMRRALSDPVSGADLSLYQIGITTSTSYQDKGKLIIDEEKLKQAIKDNPDKLAQLFTKESQYSYSDGAHRTNRYNEEGLGQRLSDILEDSIRTNRDTAGKKGYLLEKAGMVGDASEYNSLIVGEILTKDEQITTLLDQVATKESQYYAKFASMERILSQMNSQSAWLSQQMGQK